MSANRFSTSSYTFPAFQIHTPVSTATTPKAKGRLKALAMNPMSAGPPKKAAMAKVFIVAKPAPLAMPGTRAAAAYKMGAPNDTPAPTNAKPVSTATGC